MLYTLALFTHIVGVLGIFAVIALELASLFGQRRARLMEEVRRWASLHRVIAWAFPLAALLTLGTGRFMAWNAWGWKVPWIDGAFLAFIAMGLLGRLNAWRHQQLYRVMGEALSGPVPAELLSRLHDPVLYPAFNDYRLGSGLSDDGQAGPARLAHCTRNRHPFRSGSQPCAARSSSTR
jgi:hypothetical protein